MSDNSGRKQFFLSQIEIDLLVASLELLKEESNSSGCNNAHAKCRNFTHKRIVEITMKLKND